MANNNFNNKLYLENAGLQALINKLAKVEKNNQDAHAGLADDLLKLKEFLTKNVVDVFGDIDNPEYQHEVARIIALADALRAELGPDSEATEETVYARLKDLTDRIIAIEDLKLDDNNLGIDCAFYDVDEPIYNSNDQNVIIQFRNRKGDPLKKAVIDTKDFVIHGLMDGVDIVNYLGGATVTIGEGENAIELVVPDDIAKGVGSSTYGKYLVFRFKVSHEHDGNSIHDYEEMTKAVWVNVNDLFTDYTFKSEVAKGSEDYIEVKFDDTETSYTEANIVKIVVGLGSNQKTVNALVEGSKLRPGLTEESPEPNKFYRGIVDLNDGLEVVEAETEALRTELGEASEATEETVYARLSDHDTRIDKLEDTSDEYGVRLDNIEGWIEKDGVLSEDYIAAYFEYAYAVANGADVVGEEPKPSDYPTKKITESNNTNFGD